MAYYKLLKRLWEPAFWVCAPCSESVTRITCFTFHRLVSLGLLLLLLLLLFVGVFFVLLLFFWLLTNLCDRVINRWLVLHSYMTATVVMTSAALTKKNKSSSSSYPAASDWAVAKTPAVAIHQPSCWACCHKSHINRLQLLPCSFLAVTTDHVKICKNKTLEIPAINDSMRD